MAYVRIAYRIYLYSILFYTTQTHTHTHTEVNVWSMDVDFSPKNNMLKNWIYINFINSTWTTAIFFILGDAFQFLKHSHVPNCTEQSQTMPLDPNMRRILDYSGDFRTWECLRNRKTSSRLTIPEVVQLELIKLSLFQIIVLLILNWQ